MDKNNSTEEANEDTLYIRFNIIGETKEMFEFIKEHLNLRYNMEVFRYLVKRYYDELKSSG